MICLCGGFASGAMAQDSPQAYIRLTLKEALQSVDAINLQVMMANARLEQAIARIAQTQSDLLPHLRALSVAAVRLLICVPRDYRSRFQVFQHILVPIIRLMLVPV